MKRLIFDLDDTLCITPNGNYAESQPRLDVIKKLREYKATGFEIIIQTSRNVRTYQNNIGKITANTLPTIIGWLKQHDVPFDEIYIGKPWCGFDGFYIDDKAVRPSELLSMSYAEITELLASEKK
jgi:capsule biosynthesis phosphatase